MKRFVRDLKADDEIETYFALSDKTALRRYKHKSGSWFAVTLSDRTGSMQANFWGDDDDSTRRIFDSLQVGGAVAVRGTVSKYREALQIRIQPGHGSIEPTQTYDAGDLVPVTDRDISTMKSKLLREIESIQNGSLRALLQSFFGDMPFLERFSTCPAARRYHHGYVGGLLEHVLSMVEVAKTIHKSYPSLDLDIMKAGCILHDIGKVEAYDAGIAITITSDGRYVGHIAAGTLMVRQRMAELRRGGVPFDDHLEQHIIHIILSHHGKLEFGSPVEPQTPEAVAIHHIDSCDAHIRHATANGRAE